MSNVIHVSTQAFDRLNAQPVPVLLDFWAPWCGPCRMQGPILDEVAQRAGEGALVGKINVDEEPELAARFGVASIPTLVLMKGGKVVTRMVGVQQAATLLDALAEAR
jgi:thioredoxin 1